MNGRPFYMAGRKASPLQSFISEWQIFTRLEGKPAHSNYSSGNGRFLHGWNENELTSTILAVNTSPFLDFKIFKIAYLESPINIYSEHIFKSNSPTVVWYIPGVKNVCNSRQLRRMWCHFNRLYNMNQTLKIYLYLVIWVYLMDHKNFTWGWRE